MPGVGKSTAGVVLAKVAGYQFIDADLLIQKAEGKKLSEIIEEVGVDGFLEIENRVNASVRAKRSVIATGGSAVYGEAAMKHYKKTAVIVYLKTSYRVLSRRLRNLKSRGVVLREGQDLKALYNERVPLYEKYADIIINQDGLGIEETVAEILDKIANME
ncbi:MAG: shikimate kinase [Eubacterium sp.]|nr:shikimate kinase [Eubacterium sp.]